MTKPDLMAELAKVPVVAYAWRKEGMNGWALGHNPPTPNMPDFDKYEVRELTFRIHHAELEAMARDAARYRWWRKKLEVTRNAAVPDRIGIRERFILVELQDAPDDDYDYIDQAIDDAMRAEGGK